VLAHAGAADESLALLLLTAGLWLGWAAVSRVRGTGFARMSRRWAWVLAGAAAGLLVAAAVVPRALFPATPTTPAIAAERPASSATLAIREPADGRDVAGSDLDVVLRLDGGTIVDATTTRLTPDTGHIHLSVDGEVVSMTYGLVQVVDLRDLAPGAHQLQAEYVAADHGPFAPRVIATVSFRTEPA
jgi:hypothetical protein